MPGGLLNIVSYGNQNVILNGNPSKTMFKTTYAKYTNFGLQKFRIDFDGSRNLRLTDPSTFTFKMPRYAELLMDTYLVVTLPTIWSPLRQTKEEQPEPQYEFRWIDNLGSQMIKTVTFRLGGQIIQKFSGQYLLNLVERDFTETQKQLYYNMTGNISELNNPQLYRDSQNIKEQNTVPVNGYPNAVFDDSFLPQGPEPSIRARKLYIPLNIWFTLAAKMALPLVSLQYNEIYIDVEMRPINELFMVRDVSSETNNYIQANQQISDFQFYRFLQPPPNTKLDYSDKRTDWAADVHLISTYAFLSEEEAKLFASKQQQYLIKEVYEYNFQNVTTTNRVKLESLGLVSNWMWYFQRSDINLRNQWSNYTNWEYNYLPSPLINYPTQPAQASYTITGKFAPENQKTIMNKWGLLLGGKYRENTLDAGVLQYVEKYTKSKGNLSEDVYCYNFCLHTSPYDFQPSGAINLSKFKNIEFEFTTYQPPRDPSAQVFVICDPETNEIISVNSPSWRIYDYNYDLTIFEERYNILTFTSGNAGLMYAR